ncbi:hypothetical protein E4U43_000879 [Claviceps pusilla]|uniref:Uncharacterized protein n=1 Tax=Claviceps pusilla TaxID=123648 RepID=A0A9P7SZN4_9HYPO|nr:hypothetical protein E4U43_000879 [Claviceps pusilla]
MSSSAKCPSQDAGTAIALKRETVLVDLRDAPLESQPQRNKKLSSSSHDFTIRDVAEHLHSNHGALGPAPGVILSLRQVGSPG